MAQSPIIHALIEKRAEVSGRIADLEERTRQARAGLAHIDATLRLFDPEAILGAIAAKSITEGRRLIAQLWFASANTRTNQPMSAPS